MVGHYGFRKAFGDNFSHLAGRIYLMVGHKGLSEIDNDPSMLRRINSTVKQWLSDMGININMSDDDVRALLTNFGVNDNDDGHEV